MFPKFMLPKITSEFPCLLLTAACSICYNCLSGVLIAISLIAFCNAVHQSNRNTPFSIQSCTSYRLERFGIKWEDFNGSAKSTKSPTSSHE